MPKAAIWLRVSSEEQDASNQLKRLQAYLKGNDLELVHTYRLDGVSAYADDATYTKTLSEMLKAAHTGQFEVLLVWSLDRLSRHGIEHMMALLREIEGAGVTIVSIQEPWVATGGDFRDLLLAFFAWVAQYESRRTSDRIKAGLVRRAAAGQPVGRQPGAKDKRPRKRSGYYRRWEEARKNKAVG